jgi:hypothetical protein
MSTEELKNREKKIRSNFASIFLLMAAIAIGTLVGVLCIVKLF